MRFLIRRIEQLAWKRETLEADRSASPTGSGRAQGRVCGTCVHWWIPVEGSQFGWCLKNPIERGLRIMDARPACSRWVPQREQRDDSRPVPALVLRLNAEPASAGPLQLSTIRGGPTGAAVQPARVPQASGRFLGTPMAVTASVR